MMVKKDPTTLDFIVEYILPNYSDETLFNMLEQRSAGDSLLREALLDELEKRLDIAAGLSKKYKAMQRRRSL